MQTKVVVLEYGSGNVRSVMHALARQGVQAELSADPVAVAGADGLLVPGVGAFGAVMTQLRAVRGDQFIERRLAGGRPVLGICVGLQVMFETSAESGPDVPGLAQWPGVVQKLTAPIVPHMGWSEVRAGEGSRLLAGLDGQRFYFVHSFAAKADPAELLAPSPVALPVVSWAKHGEDFVAAVENGPLCATQFHPEKSGDVGAELLRNWIATLK